MRWNRKIALYNNDLGHIKDTVDEMNDNLKSLMEKPGKLQDKIIAYVITGIIGIVLGFALKGIFPGVNIDSTNREDSRMDDYIETFRR